MQNTKEKELITYDTGSPLCSFVLAIFLVSLQYPPRPRSNVPPADVDINELKAYAMRYVPYWFPPEGPGMNLKSLQYYADITRIMDRPELWHPEFNYLQNAFPAWLAAAQIMEDYGLNSEGMLTDITNGCEPMWLTMPPTNFVFAQQAPPSSMEALEAELEAVWKNIAGKSSDPSPTSVVVGPSSVPVCVQHCPSWSIRKGPTFQIIFDCSNTTKRIVIDNNAVKVRLVSSDSDPRGSWFEVQILFPTGPTPRHPCATTPNMAAVPITMFNVCTADFTALIELKQFFRAHDRVWGNWIDLSSAYFLGKLHPIFQIHSMGTFIGDIFMGFSSFPFGWGGAVPSFQLITSHIVNVAKAFCPRLFGKPGLTNATPSENKPPKCLLANYLDDDFILAPSKQTSDEAYDVLHDTTEFLGGKMSKKKKLRSARIFMLLGIMLNGIIGCFSVPDEKAEVILTLINSLLSDPSGMSQDDLESLVGKLSHLGYLSTHGLRHVYPINMLQWLPKGARRECFRPEAPHYDKLMKSIKWWKTLLKSKQKILWNKHDEPDDWICVVSDASEEGWCITDVRDNFLAGEYSSPEPIARLEMRAMNKYLEHFGPSCKTGIIWLCDNRNCVYNARKKYTKSTALQKEFDLFADNCERYGVHVASHWVSTHKNLVSDLGTRRNILLGAALNDSMMNSKSAKLMLDEGAFNQCLLESIFGNSFGPQN